MRAVLLLALIACGSEPAKPAPPKSQDCDDPALPYANDYSDQTVAEAAGCHTKRIYGAIKDPKTGEMRDNERWVFCCPKPK
jgi:hypothetical protein